MVTKTDRDLSKLQPEFKKQVEAFLAANPEVFVTEAYRSQERQDWLYASGRTRPGRVVTWTKNSQHTKGLAIDIAFKGDQLYPSVSDPRWRKVADSAKQFGIDWGYDLWEADAPHFQDALGPYDPPKSALPQLNKRASSNRLAMMAAFPLVFVVAVMPWLPNSLGLYHQFRDEIYLKDSLNRTVEMYDQEVNLEKYVKVHEFAHWVSDERQSDQVMKLACSAFKETGYSPTEYGETNCEENFAEIYTGLYMGLLPYNGDLYQHRHALNAMQRWEQPHELFPELLN